jgi:hypothetical protein
MSAMATGAVNTVTTGALTTSASGSIFVVCCVGNTGGTRSVTDSKGNTYALVTNGGPLTNTNSGYTVYIYACVNGTGGASHTFTFNDSAQSVPGAFAFEITGAATSSALDVDAGAGNTAGTPVNNPVTTTVTNDLVVSFCLDERLLDTPAIGGGFTSLLSESNAVLGVSFGAGWKAAPTTGSYDPTYTVSATKQCAVWTGAFKQLAGGAIPNNRGIYARINRSIAG